MHLIFNSCHPLRCRSLSCIRCKVYCRVLDGQIVKYLWLAIHFQVYFVRLNCIPAVYMGKYYYVLHRMELASLAPSTTIAQLYSIYNCLSMNHNTAPRYKKKIWNVNPSELMQRLVLTFTWTECGEWVVLRRTERELHVGQIANLPLQFFSYSRNNITFVNYFFN